MQGKPKLRGWTALGGTSRRYGNAKGQSISRREYENKLLRKHGWKTRYEAEQFRRSQEFRQAKARMAKPKRGRKRQRLTIFDEYARFLHEADWEQVDLNWNLIAQEDYPRDLSPEGLTAQNLVILGIRSPEWEWNVGETPANVSLLG